MKSAPAGTDQQTEERLERVVLPVYWLDCSCFWTLVVHLSFGSDDPLDL